MDPQARRDDEKPDDSRRASTDHAGQHETDDLARRGSHDQRPPLTKREREDRWPIG